jgi:hypothetical protein
MIRFVEIIAAIGVVSASFVFAQSQPSVTQGDQPNRVAIEYIAPKDAGLQDLYEILKIRGALERIQKILSPLRLPEELTVKTAECGKVDATYRRVSQGNHTAHRLGVGKGGDGSKLASGPRAAICASEVGERECQNRLHKCCFAPA